MTKVIQVGLYHRKSLGKSPLIKENSQKELVIYPQLKFDTSMKRVYKEKATSIA